MPSMNVSEKTKKARTNKKIKKLRNKAEDFKILEFVSIKIDKVDKTSPQHLNVLLGKVTEVDNTMLK